MNKNTLFPIYKVTNGHWKFKDDEESMEMGCIGQIDIDTTTSDVVLKCEGKPVDSVAEIETMKIKFTGHINNEIYDRLIGIKTDGLKDGIRTYGADSKGESGTLTFDAMDLYGSDVKLLAFPICKASTGYKLAIKNGESEVAEVEMEFEVYKDEFMSYVYEAFKSKADQETIEKWHTSFNAKDVRVVV